MGVILNLERKVYCLDKNFCVAVEILRQKIAVERCEGHFSSEGKKRQY